MTASSPLVACVLHLEEALAVDADVYVFPEGCARVALEATSREKRHAFVVGAFEDGEYSRGALFRSGEMVMSYLKVFSDGRTRGNGIFEQLPVYCSGDDLGIGVLVCLDVDEPASSLPVLDALRETYCRHRLLCVPADMGSHWFPHRELLGESKYAGAFVALCNNIKTHGDHGCKSFVTDTSGIKRAIQKNREPLVHRLCHPMDRADTS